MTAARNALKAGRVFHIFFLVAAFLNIWLSLRVLHPKTHQVPREIVLAFAFVALTNVGLAVYFRSRDVQPSAETLRFNPDDARAAGQWRRGVLLSLVFCLTIVLFGLSLRILGLAWNFAGIFYAVGILLMLAWTPRLDLPPQ